MARHESPPLLGVGETVPVLHGLVKSGTLLGSYEILGRLGAGSMGEVYRARDVNLHRDVAIKILPDEIASDEGRLRRFEQEALTASSLSHPNIVHIYALGDEGGKTFVVMELVEGETLRDLIQRGPLPPERVLDYGRQIAAGLAKSHSAGIVHRDLKPENLMVSTDDYIKILDFGLAKNVRALEGGSEVETQTRLGTRPGVVLGTVGYMSPEQARGEAADTRSDQFALGAVLYELATGRRAFEAASAVETLSAIIAEEPEPLTRLAPTMPPAFGRVVHRCLAKHRDGRFDDTAAIVGELRGIDPALSTSVPPASHTVGRNESLRELREAADSVRAGAGAVRSIAGEAGIGKTTLVETFLEDLDHVIVCRGRCSERLAGAEAYLPFLDALEGLSGQVQYRRLLKETAPRWHEQIVSQAHDRPAQRVSSQEQMKREMAGFLESLSKRAPVVVFLDDLHWADASTVDLLAYLGARLDRMRVLFVLTYRPADLQLADHPFVPFKLDLQARGSLREIHLPFLSLDEVRAYIDLTFPDNAFPRELADLIYEKTEGNPLFMVDLLRYLRDKETLALRDGRWVVVGLMGHIERDLPQSVRGMIERKLGRLHEEDRKLMAVAAVEGYRFRSAILAKVLEVDPADIEERLEALERIHGLVKLAGEEELPDGSLTARYQFIHVLYQNALDASVTPSRRVSLSRRVAQVKLDAFEGQTAKVASELAVLFERGREWARAANCYRLASGNANEVFASREAMRLAQKGIDLLRRVDDSRERNEEELRLQLALGMSLVALKGHSSEGVGDAYSRAWELSQILGGEIGMASALAGIWGYRAVRGDSRGALEAGRRLLELAESHGEVEGVGLARLELGATLFYRGAFEESMDQLIRGLELADDCDTTAYGFELDLGINCRRMLACTEWIMGYPDRARARIGEALELATARKHLFNKAYALFFAGFLASFLRDREDTKRFGENLVELSREQGYRLFELWGELLVAWSAGTNTDLQRSRDLIETVREQIEAELLLPFWLGLASELQLRAGRYDEALESLAEASEIADRTEQHFWDAEIHRLRGEAHRLKGVAGEEVEVSFRTAVDVARRQRALSLELRAATSLARLLAAEGEREEARVLLVSCYEKFTEGFDSEDLTSARSLLDALKDRNEEC